MALIDQVNEGIKQAMLSRDKVRLEALRGIKKEFLEAMTAKGAAEQQVIERRVYDDNED